MLVEGHQVDADVWVEPGSLTLTGMVDVDLWDALVYPSFLLELPYQ